VVRAPHFECEAERLRRHASDEKENAEARAYCPVNNGFFSFDLTAKRGRDYNRSHYPMFFVVALRSFREESGRKK
jgi:hypothetical protein